MPTRPAQPSRTQRITLDPAMPSGTAHAMWMNDICPTRIESDETRVITSPTGWPARAPRSMRRYLRSTWVRSSALTACVFFHASDHWCLCARESRRWKPPRQTATSSPCATAPRRSCSNHWIISRTSSGPRVAHNW